MIQSNQETRKPELAVIIPIYNEAANILSLLDEISLSLSGFINNYEIIFVDDGSEDNSVRLLQKIRVNYSQLRILVHHKCCGQTASIITGICSTEASLIATLDGDGQNDPADIPELYKTIRNSQDRDSLLIVGNRTNRQDTLTKRISSKIANNIRGKLLKDNTPDTGCGLKIFSRSAFLKMPHFDHMHRFLPALMIRNGGRVISVEVNHRPRKSGLSKYGTIDRLFAGIFDVLGVLWLQKRSKKPLVKEIISEDDLPWVEPP